MTTINTLEQRVVDMQQLIDQPERDTSFIDAKEALEKARDEAIAARDEALSVGTQQLTSLQGTSDKGIASLQLEVTKGREEIAALTDKIVELESTVATLKHNMKVFTLLHVVIGNLQKKNSSLIPVSLSTCRRFGGNSKLRKANLHRLKMRRQRILPNCSTIWTQRAGKLKNSKPNRSYPNQYERYLTN